jgi:anti-sigma factor RsiW
LRCKDAIQEISNFLDGELGDAVKHELEQHFKECEHCHLVVVQTRQAIEFFLESEPEELPVEVKTRLHGMLRRKLSQPPA